jgi:hypothetical protein
MARLVNIFAVAGCALGIGSLWVPVTVAQTNGSHLGPEAPIARGAEARPPLAGSATGYYIEFRVAQIGTYGHSYVAYGRLNGRRQPADAQYADLHPMGNYAVMMLGHILPVPANMEWDPDVLKLPIASTYRRNLNAAEYRKLLAALQRARATKQRTWNAVSNNCNHFVAELARAVGLRTPNNFQLSYSFVPALRDLNEPGGSSAKASRINQAPASIEQQPRT